MAEIEEERSFHIEESGPLRAHKLNGLAAEGWRTVQVMGDTVIMRRKKPVEATGPSGKKLLTD